jgi:putative hemolysin
VVQAYQYIGHIVLMLLLLCGSAFFSASETAFFNLSRRQQKLFEKSAHKLENLVSVLLSNPRRLLNCLLFGNMTVNVLFYAMVSVLVIHIEEQSGVVAAGVIAGTAFCSLVFFGEIFPKSLAYSSPKAISIAGALPVFLCLQVFTPIVSVFQFLMVEPAIRLFLGPTKHVKTVATSEFKTLVKQARKCGLITVNENKLITEIIELNLLKVRNCLRPRVDMAACATTDSNQRAREVMRKHNLTKIPVYIKTIDNIVGQVSFRQLLLHPDKPLNELVYKTNFVPEQKTIESLLEFFRTTGTDTAIVVDEYGGIAGSINLEDIAEELLGPIEVGEDVKPIDLLGPFEYRLAGNLNIHDWAQSFGINPAEMRLSTVGGLVTTVLGRMPKTGDVAYIRNLKFTVERMRNRKIETVILTFELIPQND